MGYKGYYTFKCKAEKEVDEINFDWVNVGAYTFDVHEADGFNWDGKDVNCAGSFTFECEVDEEPAKIDWDTFDEDLIDVEATFSLFDEENEPVDFDECEFEFFIYDDEKKERTGKTHTVFAGNM